MNRILVNFDREIFISQCLGGISHSFAKLIENFLSNPDLGVTANLTFRRSNNEHLREVLRTNHQIFAPQRKFVTAKSGYSTALTLGPIRTASSLWAGGKPILHRADVFHATYYRPNVFERQFNQKLAVTVHDFIPEKLGWNGLRNPHIGKAKLIQKADLIICVSQATANDLNYYLGISDERVKVVHHGVDVDQAMTPKDFKSVGEKPKILYVGHRSSYKNFAILLKSLQILGASHQFQLVVAGPILTQIEIVDLNALVGAGNWMFVESPRDEELKVLYREAAVHCVTSKLEGFGMTILEAMAQGTPTIVSSIEVFREICGDSAIYFDADDPEDLAAKLKSVIFESEYGQLSAMVLEQARKYSWISSSLKLATAYSRTIS